MDDLRTPSGKRFPTLHEIKRDVILKRVELALGNKSLAARSLGMNVRSLRRFLNIFALEGFTPKCSVVGSVSEDEESH